MTPEYTHHGPTMASTLEPVLRAQFQDRDLRVWDYETEAASLWESLAAAPAGAGMIIVIWTATDGLAAGAEWPDATHYLNPLAWAICALSGNPQLQISIVDLAPETHRGQPLYETYSVLDQAAAPFDILNDIYSCLPELLARGRGHRHASRRTAALAGIRRQLTELLVNGPATSRHAMANVLGPMVLLGAEESWEGAPERALFRLCGSLGLVAAHSDHGTADGDQYRECVRGEPFRALLVDDQAHFGWNRWVAKILEGHDGVTLEWTESAGAILEGLERAFDEGKFDQNFNLDLPHGEPCGRKRTESDRRRSQAMPFAPYRFYLDESAPEGDASPLLILDLRLHSLKSISEEVDFVQRVLGLCVKLIERRSNHLPWPAFSAEELADAQAWCKQPTRDESGPTANYVVTLTLLPRLLALVDPSLPIIVFSTTGRRAITERLRPYGNIITSFVKPQLGSAGNDDLARRTSTSFLEAIDAARHLMSVRRRVAWIQRDAQIANESTIVSVLGDQLRARYVELFVDETPRMDGNNFLGVFSVGGCFAVFDAADDEAAQVKADAFDDYLVSDLKVNYFNRTGSWPYDPHLTMQEKGAPPANSGVDLSLVPENVRPTHIGVVRMRIDMFRNVQPGQLDTSLADMKLGDNRYHAALRALLETFLCESLPALYADAGSPRSDKISASVYVATKSVSAPEREIARHAMYAFGYEYQRGGEGRGRNFHGLNRISVVPIVADICDGRRARFEPHRVIGVSLRYKKLPEFHTCRQCRNSIRVQPANPQSGATSDDMPKCCPDCKRRETLRPDYRAWHYIADEALTEFPVDGRLGKYDELFGKSDAPGEFDEIFDELFVATQKASRALDHGDYGSAIAWHRPQLPLEAKPRASRLLSRRLAARLGMVSGNDILLAASLMESARRVRTVPKDKPLDFNYVCARWRIASRENGAEMSAPYDHVYQARISANTSIYYFDRQRTATVPAIFSRVSGRTTLPNGDEFYFNRSGWPQQNRR